ncbi:MAG: hypothetical protein COB04_01300 [Gammaproteobacteria bacterium]|nr:MAG: hypothetical protein COB04_01300 [Gammaproteobacteria bacterium]
MFIKNELHYCDYLPRGLDNLAVLLKGTSLEKLPEYSDQFEHCLIVSDYDDELAMIGKSLQDKNIIHFTNRSKQASLSKKNYKKYNISNIQLGQVFRLNHYRLMESMIHYKLMGIQLNVHSLPEKLLSYGEGLGEEYSLKFPNTGILSLIYSLEMIRPRNLWVFGLDFYSTPYMAKQVQSSPIGLDGQAGKLGRLDLLNYVYSLFRRFPETNINMVSYYPGWPAISNMSRVL